MILGLQKHNLKKGFQKNCFFPGCRPVVLNLGLAAILMYLHKAMHNMHGLVKIQTQCFFSSENIINTY